MTNSLTVVAEIFSNTLIVLLQKKCESLTFISLYIVKLGFIGIYIILLISKHRLRY